MNEWGLLAGFIVLLMLALSVALYPLRKHRASVLLLTPIVIVLVGIAYLYWGAWPERVHFIQDRAKQERIQAMLKSMNEPTDLIKKLKAILQTQPNSARGWYLLGRMYASQHQWMDANQAFAHAYRLQPNDEQIAVNYAQNLWQLNHQQYDDNSRGILKSIVVRNPNQPDALAMLAMDAYTSRDYRQAIDYWQVLLKLAPSQSEEARAIRKAIAKAQAMMSTRP